MTDLHIHTRASFDSEEDPAVYIAEAEKRGEKYLGFSEHYDYDVIADGGKIGLADIGGCFSVIDGLQKTADVKILKGAELGYSAGAVAKYKQILKDYAFDYTILSVHTLSGRGDCYFPEFFAGLSARRAYTDYFQAVLESVRSDIDFDILGHVGYVSRNAPYDERRIIYSQFKDILDEILKETIARGVCLEINTSVGKSGATFIPDVDVLDRFLELGGKYLTFGSDAHRAAKYLYRSEEVKNFLSSRGVDGLYRVENRKKIKEKF